MSTKISALPTTTAAAAADVVPLVQSSTTKQVTVGGMLAAVSGDGSISSSGVLAIGQLTGVAAAVAMLAASLTWGASLTPTIGQSISTTGAGATFSITSQAAKVGSAAAGGNLVLSGGAPDGVGAAGSVLLQSGGVTVATVATAGITLASTKILSFTDGTGFVASAGTIRTAPTFSIVGRNSANAVDVTLIQWDGSNNINIGQASGVGILSLAGNAITAYSSGTIYADGNIVTMRGAAHGTTMFTATDTTQTIALTSLIQSTGATITPVNGANALTAAQSKQFFLRVLAGATAAVTLTSTAAANVGNMMLVKNETTQTVTFAWATGTGIAIPTTTSMWVGCDGTNAIKLGAMT